MCIRDRNSKEEFIEAVKQSGLVGLGGAGFPAHIKLNPKDKIEYLCINAAECEPYITADVREIMENHENVLYGISQVMKYVGIDKALIGIEDNKPEAVSYTHLEVYDRKGFYCHRRCESDHCLCG